MALSPDEVRTASESHPISMAGLGFEPESVDVSVRGVSDLDENGFRFRNARNGRLQLCSCCT